MINEMKIECIIVDALKFFGPLPASILREKCLERGHNICCSDIDNVAKKSNEITEASGYTKLTWKVKNEN
jgi:hypothetical protein